MVTCASSIKPVEKLQSRISNSNLKGISMWIYEKKWGERLKIFNPKFFFEANKGPIPNKGLEKRILPLVNKLDGNGMSILVLAIIHNLKCIFQTVLLCPGRDVNQQARISFYSTPLQYSLYSGRHPFITDLINCPDIDINQQSSTYGTVICSLFPNKIDDNNYYQIFLKLFHHPSTSVDQCINKESQTIPELSIKALGYGLTHKKFSQRYKLVVIIFAHPCTQLSLNEKTISIIRKDVSKIHFGYRGFNREKFRDALDYLASASKEFDKEKIQENNFLREVNKIRLIRDALLKYRYENPRKSSDDILSEVGLKKERYSPICESIQWGQEMIDNALIQINIFPQATKEQSEFLSRIIGSYIV